MSEKTGKADEPAREDRSALDARAGKLVRRVGSGGEFSQDGSHGKAGPRRVRVSPPSVHKPAQGFDMQLERAPITANSKQACILPSRALCP